MLNGCAFSVTIFFFFFQNNKFFDDVVTFCTLSQSWILIFTPSWKIQDHFTFLGPNPIIFSCLVNYNRFWYLSMSSCPLAILHSFSVNYNSVIYFGVSLECLIELIYSLYLNNQEEIGPLFTLTTIANN